MKSKEEHDAFLRAKKRVRNILEELAEVCHDVRGHCDSFGAANKASENLGENLEDLGITYSWVCLAVLESDPDDERE